jgi:hypothetical protein
MGPRRSALRSIRGLPVGPRRPAPRPRAHRGASVLRHHHHQVRRHRNRHHHRARRHHLRGSSNNSSNSGGSSRSSGRPASRVARRSRAPSKCSPSFFSLVIMPTGLNPSSAYQGFLPSAPKVAPAGGSGAQKQASARSGAGDPPPAAAAETAPPGSHAPAGGSATAVPLTATVASTMVMPSSTPSIVVGDVGGASSSIPSPTLEETEVVLGWWLWSGAEPEVALVLLPRVLSHAHQALHESKAAILREWEALEAEH